MIRHRFDNRRLLKIRQEIEMLKTEALAIEVIRGRYGNGHRRKQILGDKYEDVQEKVNEMIGTTRGKKIPPRTEEENWFDF